MPLDYSRPTPAAPPADPLRHIGLLVLRLVTGCTLMIWHAGREAAAGWLHLWYKTSWDLPGQLGMLGFPVPLAVGIGAVIICLLGATFIILGLLTRVSALLICSLSVITAILYAAFPVVAESAVLLAGASLAIAFCGPGALSLDKLLKMTTRRRA